MTNPHLPIDQKYDLLQLRYLYDPWKATIACILLNRTKRAQVDKVINELFYECPTPLYMSWISDITLISIIEPLGFKNRRCEMLKNFSEDYIKEVVTIAPRSLCNPSRPKINNLFKMRGVGQYALDSFRIFFNHDWYFEPEDKELAKYCKFMKKRYKKSK